MILMQMEPPTEFTKLDTSELGLQSLLPIRLTLSSYSHLYREAY